MIDPAGGDANLEYAHRRLECAAALGAPVVNIGFHRPLLLEQLRTQFWMVPGAADDRGEETLRLAVDRVREIAVHAATLDLRINPDLGNLVRVPAALQSGWVDLLRECLPYMNYWHVKNFIRLEHPHAGVFLSYPT